MHMRHAAAATRAVKGTENTSWLSRWQNLKIIKISLLFFLLFFSMIFDLVLPFFAFSTAIQGSACLRCFEHSALLALPW
jgi:hypothetical protein